MADQRSLLFLSKLYHLDNNRDGCVLHWSAARFLFLHSSDSLIPKVCIATILLFACNSCSDKRPSGLSVRTFSENFKKDLTTSLFCLKRLCLLGFQRVRCLANTSLNTSLNRSFFFSDSCLFLISGSSVFGKRINAE